MARISIPVEVIAVDDQDLATTLSNNELGWHASSRRVSWNIQWVGSLFAIQWFEVFIFGEKKTLFFIWFTVIYTTFIYLV